MTSHSPGDDPRLIDVSGVSLAQLRDLDDSALTHALRRFQQESSDAQDPIAAFGAFNQHGSSPW